MRRCITLFTLLVLPALVLAEDKPLTPEEAAKKVNEKVTVELEIKSVGENNKKTMTYLNSEANFRSEKNLTILIESKNEEKFTKAGVIDPKGFYKGKIVRVTGTVTLFMDKPQIKLEGPDQIKVVEKK